MRIHVRVLAKKTQKKKTPTHSNTQSSLINMPTSAPNCVRTVLGMFRCRVRDYHLMQMTGAGQKYEQVQVEQLRVEWLDTGCQSLTCT